MSRDLKEVSKRLLEEECSAEGARAKALSFSKVHLVCFLNVREAGMARAEGPVGSKGLTREVKLSVWVREQILKRPKAFRPL